MSRFQSRSVYSPKRSQIDLSCEHLTTLDFFRLQPIYCQEMISGQDTFNVNIDSFVESAPFVQRVYGSCHLDLHAFFVPYSIIWAHWNSYFYGDSQSNVQSYSIPYTNFSDFHEIVAGDGYSLDQPRVFGSLGYPCYADSRVPDMPLSLLPALAYQQIWWDYYRDSRNIEEKDKHNYILSSLIGYQDEPSVLVPLFTPRYRTYRKDYVSTLIQNPQLGTASSARVSSSAPNLNTTGTTEYIQLDSNGNVKETIARDGVSQISRQVSAEVLRGTIAMQRYLERLGIAGGTRPIERLLAEFGVESPRMKLNMCDFIGSKSVPINIQGMVNLGSSQHPTNQPALGLDGSKTFAFGKRLSLADAISKSQTFSYTAKEQGLFMVVASLIPDFNYYNQLAPEFTRGLNLTGNDKLDFYRPDFSNLGYEEVLLPEVHIPYVDPDDTYIAEYDPYQVVGYRPKYESYRFAQNKVTGDFLAPFSRNSLFYSCFTRDFHDLGDYTAIQAGLNLTTSSETDKIFFDKYFANSENDHFVCRFMIGNNANRPIDGNTMPEELTHVLNSGRHDVSFGGVRL